MAARRAAAAVRKPRVSADSVLSRLMVMINVIAPRSEAVA